MWSGRVGCCKAARTAGRMRPAAHPQTELTTIMVVPAWVVTARSTSSAVRSSCTPALVSSSRMGMSMSSGYIAAPLGFDDCNAGLDDEECGLDAGNPAVYHRAT